MPKTMPTLFIPHGGGPCFFMDWDPPGEWDKMAAFLRGLAATLPARPEAIILVSGHWQRPVFTAGSGAHPVLIYDYSGFPPHTYQLQYPASGKPALADEMRGLLREAGLEAGEDAARGFDHGVFIPLKLVFPGADIPIVTLSVRDDLDTAAHLAAGRALSALRETGVLIIGSGMSFHNMRGLGNPRFGPISGQFDDWLTEAVENPDPAKREAALIDWANAPGARQSHPPRQEEHLIPLMVAAGAAPGGVGRRVFNDRVMGAMVSGYRFD